MAVFGRVCQLTEDIPAYSALSLAVMARSDHQPSEWRCPRQQLHHLWMSQIQSNSVPMCQQCLG